MIREKSRALKFKESLDKKAGGCFQKAARLHSWCDFTLIINIIHVFCSWQGDRVCPRIYKGSRRQSDTTLEVVPRDVQPTTSSTMKAFIILTVLVSAAVSQMVEPNYPPIPFSFSYAANTEDGGSSSRQESGDGAGRVQGSYTVTDLEGGNRVVEYVADEGGFRANIRTNELGTANMNPADVNIESSAPDVSGVSTYSMGGAGAPIAAPVRPAAPIASAGGRAGVRYVLVPVTDPRARGYY